MTNPPLALVTRICDRLKRLYQERTVLPGGGVMGLALLQRLFRAVISEFGE